MGHLLDLVEQGEEVLITPHDKQVARLIAQPTLNREAPSAVVARLRQRAEKQKLGRFDWLEWKLLRDEGRLFLG